MWNSDTTLEYVSWSKLQDDIRSLNIKDETFDIAIGVMKTGGVFIVNKVAQHLNIPEYEYLIFCHNF